MLESLNILHMSSDALAAYLNEQMLSNPLLEWRDVYKRQTVLAALVIKLMMPFSAALLINFAPKL